MQRLGGVRLTWQDMLSSVSSASRERSNEGAEMRLALEAAGAHSVAKLPQVLQDSLGLQLDWQTGRAHWLFCGLVQDIVRLLRSISSDLVGQVDVVSPLGGMNRMLLVPVPSSAGKGAALSSACGSTVHVSFHGSRHAEVAVRSADAEACAMLGGCIKLALEGAPDAGTALHHTHTLCIALLIRKP